MRASNGGQGEFVLKVAPGCHRLEILAEIPTVFPHRATDIDAELRDLEDERVLARDRADTPDARFDVCFGEAKVIAMKFAGASGAVTVMASDAVWAISPSIPAHWGARARAAFAGALLKRRIPDPKGTPVFEALGVQGATSVPVELLPGTCYVVSMGLIRGEAHGMRLTARVGPRAPRDEVLEHTDGASVVFCTESEHRAIIDIETRGASAWWALSVWAMGQGSP
jgi:hypothetical protein